MKIHKIAAATLMPVLALGAMVLTGGSASAHPAVHSVISPTGSVKAQPSKNLVDGTQITLTIDMGVPTPDGIHVAECDPRVAGGTQDPSWCDLTDAHVINDTSPAAQDGTATESFTVHTGANFLATHKGAECDFASPNSTCYIVATNEPATGGNAPPSVAGFAIVTFKDLRTATTTKLKAKKTVTVGKKVTVTATTKHSGHVKLSGKVAFTDNKKKCATVKEKSTGKVTAKCKVVKGKNKITATYSGDKFNYKPSTGKATVTGKKKK